MSDAAPEVPIEPNADTSTVFAGTPNNAFLDAEKELVAPGARPIEIVKDGRVATDLLV